MAARQVPEAHLRRAVELLEQAFKEGHRPGRGASLVAFKAGVEEGLLTNQAQIFQWMHLARERFGLVPDESLWRPARYQQPMPRTALVSAEPVAQEPPEGAPERIMVIGDLHQDPRHPDRLDVLTWLGRRAAEQRTPRIIQIGDWSTWDSVNMHDGNETVAARLKPGIKQDQDNLVESLQHWRRGIGDHRPKQTVVYGNHENRLERFENLNPEAHETFTLARDQAFAQFGWKTRPYGELFYVQGVAFTHHPVNGAGRAFGGKTGPQRAANETTVPVVSGHTHRRQVHDAPKIGPADVISMVEVGCGLPWGVVESYARHSLTGWWWGVVEMTVQDGAITDLNFISMLSLRDRYSDDGA